MNKIFLNDEGKISYPNAEVILLFLSISLILLFLSPVLTAQSKFVLDGYVEGSEGKWKIIINEIKNHEADMLSEQTTEMIDGHFKIRRAIHKPTYLSIRIRPMEMTDNPDFKSFESTNIWVDDLPMTLQAVKGNFRYALVKGNPLEDENQKLKRYEKLKLELYTKKLDSLAQLTSKEAKRTYQKIKSYNIAYLHNKNRLDWFCANPNSLISTHGYFFYIKWIPEMVSKPHARSFYNTLNESLQASYYGKQIQHYINNIALNQKLEIGDHYYDISLPDSTGKEIALKALKGKVVLLDFWSSNCGPCRKEHKNYASSYYKFKEYGFDIYSVSMDRNKTHWINAMKKDKMNWTSVWDKTMAISKYTYLVSGIPQNYLINRDGSIIAINVYGKKLNKVLNKLFR